MKRVRVTIEVDESFVRLLNAHVHLKRLGHEDCARDLAVNEVLAVVFLAEARGMLSEQVHTLTPPEWRPHIEAISDERSVTDANS